MSAHDPLAMVETAVIAEELSAATRHEMRNELAIIRGAAYFVRRRVSETDLWTSDPRIAQFLSTIDEHIDKATAIADRDAVAARLYARRPEVIELAECVRAAIRGARVPPGIRFDLSGSQALVKVDAVECAVAVRCLLENAAEASPPDGTVTIRISGEGAPKEVTLEVADAGGGFEDGALGRGMEPFFTTKERHVGLGLNVAQRICRRYGGSLTVGSAEGGARVTVELPACSAVPAAAIGGPAPSRLLLVDDNDGVRLALSAVLEDEGFVVDTASTFLEASRKLAPEATAYAIALLDRHLGDRLGTDLVPLVRAAHPTTRVVLLSGTSRDDAPDADVDGAFDKAGDLAELIGALRGLLDGPR